MVIYNLKSNINANGVKEYDIESEQRILSICKGCFDVTGLANDCEKVANLYRINKAKERQSIIRSKDSLTQADYVELNAISDYLDLFDFNLLNDTIDSHSIISDIVCSFNGFGNYSTMAEIKGIKGLISQFSQLSVLTDAKLCDLYDLGKAELTEDEQILIKAIRENCERVMNICLDDFFNADFHLELTTKKLVCIYKMFNASYRTSRFIAPEKVKAEQVRKFSAILGELVCGKVAGAMAKPKESDTDYML